MICVVFLLLHKDLKGRWVLLLPYRADVGVSNLYSVGVATKNLKRVRIPVT